MVEFERSPVSMKCEIYFICSGDFFLSFRLACYVPTFFHIPRTFSVNNFIIGPYLPNYKKQMHRQPLQFAVIQHTLTKEQ